jgi:pachytene checkpoint protein 2
VATSNFPQAIDPALASRADCVIDIPLPDRDARRQILEHTAAAVAEAFPGAKSLLERAALDEAADRSEGLDGRRLRKAIALACAERREAHGDPDDVQASDLLTVLGKLRGAS